MTTLAAPSVNQCQSTLAASFTRGTDTTIVLADGTLFPSPTPLGHVAYIHNADESKWCLVIYTSKAANTLTMGGGATDYALAKNVTVGDEAYEFPIGCIVELVCAADEIAELFSDKISKTLFDANTILAADSDDTPAAVTVAEQRLLGRLTAGNIAALTSDQIHTILGADWARFYARASDAQSIPNSAWTVLLVDTETRDATGEYDADVTIGVADATEANKLHDADGGFDAGMVGAVVWNTTDNTYTTVSGFVDAGELDLTADIMVDTEGYKIYFSRFTADEDGDNQFNGNCAFSTIDDGKKGVVTLRKNGDVIAIARGASPTEDMQVGWAAAVTIDLDANDYVDMRVLHDNGTVEDTLGGTAGYVTISGHRVGVATP